MKALENYTLLETEADLQAFDAAHQNIRWMSLDTEFIGEKRYRTLLCIIQIATENGIYIFDVLQLPHIEPLLKLIQQPEVLVITHAGENDYKILYEQYQIIPTNVFDTQIAAGFVGYKYPISFGKLVEEELGIYLNKSQTVTDWERRPMRTKQIKYALEDVIPLYDLWTALQQQIDQLNRRDWVKEEMQKLESSNYYQRDPNREALNHRQINNLSLKEQAFLLRLYEWRRQKAEERNHSKEMVLPKKNIGTITRSLQMGINGLKQNRRISDRFISRYGAAILNLYEQRITEEEQKVLKEIKTPREIEPKEDICLELLYNFVQHRCLEQQVAPDLVLSRGAFKLMKYDPTYVEPTIQSGWRRQILGEELMNCFKNRQTLYVANTSKGLALKYD